MSEMKGRFGAPEGLLLCAAAVAYLALASRTVQGADTGEFATLLAVGGVAHPPGYPLFTELLRVFRWVPASSPAHAAALVTAVMGVGSVAAWVSAARAWGASRSSSVWAAALVGAAPLVWAASTEPEVFILNALLAGLLVMAAGEQAPVKGLARAALTGLVLGLGASHQHTLALLLPVAAVGAWRAARESAQGVRSVMVLCGFGLLGLLPYLGLLQAWSQGTGLLWGGPAGLGPLLHHFFRVDYGTFQLASGQGAHGGFEALWFLVTSMARNGWWVGLVLLVRPRALWALGLSWLLAGPAFVMMSNIPLEGVGARIVERFFVLPVAMLSVPAALGLDRLRAMVARPAILTVGLSVVLVVSVAMNGLEVRAIRSATIDTALRDALESVPDRAAILSDGDVLFHGLTYLIDGEGVRADVALVSPNTLRFGWYRDPLMKSLGVELPTDSSPGQVEALIRTLQAQGRDVFLTDPGSWPLGLVVVPHGTLWRALRSGERDLGPVALFELNAKVFSAFRFDETAPLPEGSWGQQMQRRYAAPWRSLAGTLAREGHAELAAKANDIARQYGATP